MFSVNKMTYGMIFYPLALFTIAKTITGIEIAATTYSICVAQCNYMERHRKTLLNRHKKYLALLRQTYHP